ncbi:ATP-binding protein [Kitasatospora sp. RB6PN24]|uniref:ATP-binding protein n=1 Tax=Kitasatospora humi TaxID=2893891 RepID=UPI001E607F83|nr:ATP-binding protein [Kitasatospora humi]MCC9310431.1 ATP-binding protein [Kitasatospora humi]
MEAVTGPGCSDGPSVVAVECSAWLDPHERSVGRARAMLREYLAGHEGGELYCADAELVLSELVSNAVVHGSAQSDRRVFVRFRWVPGRLLVEVHDASSKLPSQRPAGIEDESGRGLWLVDQLALEWGHEPCGGGGKRIWAVLGPSV